MTLALTVGFAELIAACESAYPREACGWIAAGTSAGGWTVRLATRGSREAFAFSDEDLLALAAAMRSDAPPRALFHSHPDGEAAMSAADREALALHPMPHIIVAVAGGRARAATMYEWRDGAHLEVARWNARGSQA